jgi:putative peptide zinc metalloprotease protein
MWLATRTHSEEYEAGAEILRQGEAANACYILTTGTVDLVVTRDDGSTSRLAEIASGDVFGVEGLLTGLTQQSAALARTPVSVLRIDTSDFLGMLSRFPDCAQYFILLVRQRVRPARLATIVAFPAPDNHPGVILKDMRAYRYVRLSEPGYYLWTLMDGERTVRDLSVAYFVRYQRFGVDVVLQTIGELRAAGFVDAPDVQPNILRLVSPQSRLTRLAHRLAAVSKHTFALPDPDRALSALYRFGLRFLYSLPAQLAIATVTLIGFGVFAYTLGSGRSTSAGASTVGAFLGLELQVFLHELAHSLTTKHFGREVHTVGIGWYLFLPIAFVDTSDIWLESRWRRIAVAAAGPYLNLVLSGAASCLSLVLPSSMTPLLIAFAATGYLLALLNLNPLYELDGYYVLSDLLNISNLRNSALAYLGSRLWHVPPPPVGRNQQRIFLAYGAAAVGYAVFAAGALFLGYHRLVEHFVAEVLPRGFSVVLGWVLAVTLAALLVLNLWQGLRRDVNRSRSLP